MYIVYILYSHKVQKRYCGFTQDLNKRLIEHNAGKTKSTKFGIPWIVLYSEPQPTRYLARKREKWLKSGAGREWLDEKFK